MITKILLTFFSFIVVCVVFALIFHFGNDIEGFSEDEKKKRKSKLFAVVKCCGTHHTAEMKYEYKGDLNCTTAAELYGGEKSCPFSCIGFGTCGTVCEHNAFDYSEGVAHINRDKCVGCGKCVDVCPKKLISLTSRKNHYYICCNSSDTETTRDFCATGCSGCLKCMAVCQNGAIKQQNGIMEINYTLCQNCGKCFEICERGVIKLLESKKVSV